MRVNLRVQEERAMALYDPRRVAVRRPPEWWSDGIVNLLTRIAEWIAGKMLLFVILFVLKIVFTLLRGLLQCYILFPYVHSLQRSSLVLSSANGGDDHLLAKRMDLDPIKGHD